MHSTHTCMSLNHNRHAVVKETCTDTHIDIYKHLQNIQTYLYNIRHIHITDMHRAHTYTHTHWHVHTPTHMFIFIHSNLKELALNSKTWKQHQVNPASYIYMCVFNKNNYFLEGVGRGKSGTDNMLIQHSFMELSKINVKLLPRCTRTNIHTASEVWAQSPTLWRMPPAVPQESPTGHML